MCFAIKAVFCSFSEVHPISPTPYSPPRTDLPLLHTCWWLCLPSVRCHSIDSRLTYLTLVFLACPICPMLYRHSKLFPHSIFDLCPGGILYLMSHGWFIPPSSPYHFLTVRTRTLVEGILALPMYTYTTKGSVTVSDHFVENGPFWYFHNIVSAILQSEALTRLFAAVTDTGTPFFFLFCFYSSLQRPSSVWWATVHYLASF